MTKTPKIAVVDKAPTRQNYADLFFNRTLDVDVYHLCSDASIKKPKKSDVDIVFSPEDYDFVILVGSEALKQYTKVTSITDYTGMIAPGKVDNTTFIASISPALISFRPENKPVMDKTIERIRALVTKGQSEAEGDWEGITDYAEAEEYLKGVLARCNSRESIAVGMDSETTALYARKGYLLGLCFSDKPGQGRYIHADLFDESMVQLVQDIIDSPADIVFHNLKFDQHWFQYHLNISFEKAYSEGRMHDTMLQHYTLDERAGTHGLKSLAIAYTDLGDYDYQLEEFKKNYCAEHKMKQEDFNYGLIPWDIMKPYACLHRDSYVWMADGTRKYIVDLVKDKSTELVLSYNKTTGKIEHKPITGWYKNDHRSQDWRKLLFKFPAPGISNIINRGVVSGPAFTPDHRILTTEGYKEIQHMTKGDKVVTQDLAWSKDSQQVVLGSLMGDGSFASRNGAGAGLVLAQAEARKEYLDFKIAAVNQEGTIAKKMDTRSSGRATLYTFTSRYTPEQAEWMYNTKFRETSKHLKPYLSKEFLSSVGLKALAVWYQDDGTLVSGNSARIYSSTVSPEEVENTLEWLNSLGLHGWKYHEGKERDEGATIKTLSNAFFYVNAKEAVQFFDAIAEFVNPACAYKLPEGYVCNTYAWDFERTGAVTITVDDVVTWVPPATRRGYSTSYCIDVEDNHNFVTDIGVVHNCKDPDATLRLHLKFLPIIKANPKLYSLYTTILMPGVQFLQRLEDRGVPFSKERLREASSVLTEKIQEAQDKIYSFESVNRYERDKCSVFNPASPVQLRTLLFDYEGLTPTGILTGTKQDSTNAEVLEKLAKDQNSEIAKALLEYRKFTKLQNTYIEKILENLDMDSRIRTGFHLHTTTSGRLSSSGVLNLQQLPRDDGLVKGCVKAPPGYRVVAVD